VRKAWVKALVLDRINNTPVVILGIEGTNKVVPIWIGACEAYALAMALEGMEFPRPLTHDLIFSVLESLDAKIERVIIHSVKDNTFYATIVIKDLTYIDVEEGEDEEAAFLEIDARPSDSLVLAVKKGIPIYVTNEIINEHSVELEIPTESEEKEFKKFVKNMDIDMFRRMLENRGEEDEGKKDE